MRVAVELLASLMLLLVFTNMLTAQKREVQENTLSVSLLGGATYVDWDGFFFGPNKTYDPRVGEFLLLKGIAVFVERSFLSTSIRDVGLLDRFGTPTGEEDSDYARWTLLGVKYSIF